MSSGQLAIVEKKVRRFHWVFAGGSRGDAVALMLNGVMRAAVYALNMAEIGGE